MKIAHIVCTFPPYRGGMGNSAYYFAKLTAAANHEVTVFTPKYRANTPESTAADFDFSQFKVERLSSFFSSGNAAFLPQFIWRLKKFDLVHLHYPFYGAMLPILLTKLLFNRRMKLLLHYHMDTIGTGLKGQFFKFSRFFTLPMLMKRADFISCASLDYAKNSALTDLFDRYSDKFITQPFGVDLTVFKPQPTIKQPNEKIILFVASLDKAHYFKGLPVLLKALKLLVSEQTFGLPEQTIKLVVVGEGNLKKYYQKLVADTGLNESVCFTGSLSTDELVKNYNQADVFVLPSVNQGEAFGLVLLEAMACGTPVIASNLPGVRSVFRNKVEGFLVVPGDENDLAKKISAILSNDKLRKKMSEAALNLVTRKYDWQKIGRNLVQLYFRAKYTPRQKKTWGFMGYE